MTQTELSKIVGVHVSTINNILMGRRRPSWDVAKKLAEAIPEVPVNEWMDGVTDRLQSVIKKYKS